MRKFDSVLGQLDAVNEALCMALQLTEELLFHILVKAFWVMLTIDVL